MYIERTLKQYFMEMSNFFPVMLLTGPRQVGKTTFLTHIAEPDREYVTLDDVLLCEFARTDPRGFLERYKPPLLIDEVQYAPELFRFIKIRVDEARRMESARSAGMYWLTGSQQFHMMKDVTESLAGRIGIVDMLGLSMNELKTRPSVPFLPDREFQCPRSDVDTPALFQQIWQGSFPGVQGCNMVQREAFYMSYLRTYLERDVRALENITDMDRFLRFIRSAAARTGQLLNYSDIARDADVSVMTAKNWMSVLLATGLVYLLEPYSNNLTSRLVKTPKLYMLDTGMCAYLTQWSDVKVLEAGAMAGAFFETWCFAEILKSYYHHGKSRPALFFYRDRDMKEIDLLIEEAGTLYPVEFKKSSSPTVDDFHHVNVLERCKKPIGMGAIISMYPEVVQRLPNCRFIPAPLI
ncbi:MAG: ATP-binding protein [Lentisphaerae bacterium]|nr:ATP-binding protein [Lentisphaerota bacterium]